MKRPYAKCVEPDCSLIVYTFDEYKAHRVETGHHLDQSYANSLNEKPWRGICCKSCWFARKKPCKCRCRRVNHQRGIQKVMDDYNQGFEKNKDFFSDYTSRATDASQEAHKIFEGVEKHE